MKDFEQTVGRPKEEEFSFHPKSIRRRTDPSSSRLTNGNEPLSKRLKRNEIQCQCTISIYYTRGKSDPQLVARRSAQCSITSSSAHLEDPVLDIQIEPFMFKASDLKICLRRNGADKMCISDSYILRTSIFPLDGSDLSWPPIPDGRPESSHLSIIQFTSKWLLRPGFPAEEILLPINVLVKPINGTAQEFSSEAGYGLQVAASWIYPKSALEEYNLSRKKPNIPSTSLPTPGSEPKSSSRNPFRLILTLPKIIMLDPTPPCSSAKDPQETPLQKPRGPSANENGTENEKLSLKLKLPTKLMTASSTGAAVNGIANDPPPKPKTALTPSTASPVVSAESGNPSAPPPLQRPKGIKQALPFNRTPSFAKQAQSRKDVLVEGPGPSNSILQPAKSKAKCHPVPAAPHTTFFRLQSKRPLKEGDLLDESDDEFATGWLTQKQSQTLDEFTPLSVPERKFLKVYDSFMLSENLGPVCYLPDAIYRFIAAKKAWLKDSEISPEFFKLVTKLMVDGAAPDDFLKTCRQTLYAPERGKARPRNTTGGDEIIEETETPKIQDDMCAKCVQSISTRRHSVICAHKSCQKQFHMKCVELEQKQLGWTCKDHS